MEQIGRPGVSRLPIKLRDLNWVLMSIETSDFGAIQKFPRFPEMQTLEVTSQDLNLFTLMVDSNRPSF